LFQAFPVLAPTKTPEQFIPKIFGFKIHSYAQQQREQEKEWREQKERLAKANMTW
jgi:casein kinase II subunit beta